MQGRQGTAVHATCVLIHAVCAGVLIAGIKPFLDLQVKEEGYEVDHGGNCITVFSAPNYVDQMGNKGAFIRFTGGDLAPQFTTFSAVPHPDVKPMQYANPFLGGMFGL